LRVAQDVLSFLDAFLREMFGGQRVVLEFRQVTAEDTEFADFALREMLGCGFFSTAAMPLWPRFGLVTKRIACCARPPAPASGTAHPARACAISCPKRPGVGRHRANPRQK
jgi:hypothetical protein